MGQQANGPVSDIKKKKCKELYLIYDYHTIPSDIYDTGTDGYTYERINSLPSNI